jgi:hypothetical protein
MQTPIRSGIGWIDTLFDLCVRILIWLASLFGVSYNEINIWIFCIIWPIATLILIGLIIGQWIKIRKLKRAVMRT